MAERILLRNFSTFLSFFDGSFICHCLNHISFLLKKEKLFRNFYKYQKYLLIDIFDKKPGQRFQVVFCQCRVKSEANFLLWWLRINSAHSCSIFPALYHPQLRTEGRFVFLSFWIKFYDTLKYGINLNWEIIVQEFRETIKLNVVSILKSSIKKHMARKWPFILLCDL